MSKYKIEIASVYDRENLVAEIWYGEDLIAEIKQESELLEIEFFQIEKVVFELYEFLQIIQDAKNKLLKGSAE